MMLCTVWHHFYNNKNMKSVPGRVLLLLQPATLFHGCFSHFLTLPGLGFFENIRTAAGWWGGEGLAGLQLKIMLHLRTFLSILQKYFVHILYWQHGTSLDKKIDKYHFCHHLMTSSNPKFWKINNYFAI